MNVTDFLLQKLFALQKALRANENNTASKEIIYYIYRLIYLLLA